MADTLELKTEYLKDIPVIAAKGQVDMGNCVELHESISYEVSEGRPKIVLDLHSLSFIDSACLGMLLRSLDKASEAGGTLVMVGNPFIDRVLTVTGLTHLFRLFRTPEEAANHLREIGKRAG